MSRSDHPGAADWLDSLRGRLAPDREGALREHALGCPACASTRRLAERLLAAAAEPLEEPCSALLSRAKALFHEHRPRSLGEHIRTLVATLLPAAEAEPALAGTREAAIPGAPRLYEAGPYLIEVATDPAPRGRRTTVRGRVVLREEGIGAPGLARLERHGRRLAEAPVDDLGETLLRDVNPADATLVLLLDGDRVEVSLGRS